LLLAVSNVLATVSFITVARLPVGAVFAAGLVLTAATADVVLSFFRTIMPKLDARTTNTACGRAVLHKTRDLEDTQIKHSSCANSCTKSMKSFIQQQQLTRWLQ